MTTVAFRASRGFWYEGKHVAGGTLILVTAKEARRLQQEKKGKMILTRYPGRLDRGPVTFAGDYAFQDGQTFIRPPKEEPKEPGWHPKDEDCKPCPKAIPTLTAEKPKKKRKKKKKE